MNQHYLHAVEHTWHPVHIKAHREDTEGLSELVSKNPPLVNAVSECGRTPLQLAVMRAGPVTVQWLLDHDADVTYRDCNQLTPLHHAAQHNRAILIPMLLVAGAQYDARDRWGRTPLAVAADAGADQAAVMLLRNVKMRCRALELHDYINLIDEQGETALAKACRWGYHEVARTLLYNSADPFISPPSTSSTFIRFASATAPLHDILKIAAPVSETPVSTTIATRSLSPTLPRTSRSDPSSGCQALFCEWARLYLMRKLRYLYEQGRVSTAQEVETEKETKIVFCSWRVTMEVNDNIYAALLDIMGLVSACEEESEMEI